MVRYAYKALKFGFGSLSGPISLLEFGIAYLTKFGQAYNAYVGHIKTELQGLGKYSRVLKEKTLALIRYLDFSIL